MQTIHSYSLDRTNQKVLSLIDNPNLRCQSIVDVGAGEGYFSRSVGDLLMQKHQINPKDRLQACDLNPQNFKYPDIECRYADLHNPLPYNDNQFDIAVSIEVIEHLENQFQFVRELYRITKPQGRVILTTPNILNINSRLRFFSSGFGLLFSILPLSTCDPVLLGGHIHPISLYYLAYAFYRAGFTNIVIHTDRIKKSGLFLSLLFYPLIRLSHFRYIRAIQKKHPDLYRENEKLLDWINRFSILASRTIIIEGTK